MGSSVPKQTPFMPLIQNSSMSLFVNGFKVTIKAFKLANRVVKGQIRLKTLQTLQNLRVA